MHFGDSKYIHRKTCSYERKKPICKCTVHDNCLNRKEDTFSLLFELRIPKLYYINDIINYCV